MADIETSLPDVHLLPDNEQAKAAELIESARQITEAGSKYVVEIKDADMYGKAVQFAQVLDRKIKEDEAERLSMVKPINEAKDRVQAFFHKLQNPRIEMKRAIENACTRFRVEQDRLRRLEQERLAAIEKARREMNEAHDAAAREDGERLQAFLRAWDSAISYDEDRTRAIERKKEEEARMAHAQLAEDVGNKDGVSGILQTPTALAPAPVFITAPVVQPAISAPPVPPPAAIAPPPPPPPITEIPPPGVPASFVPEIKGVSKGMKWRFKIVSKRKFLESVLNDAWGMDTITIEDGPNGPIGEKVKKNKGSCVDEYRNYGIDVWCEADDKIRSV